MDKYKYKLQKAFALVLLIAFGYIMISFIHYNLDPMKWNGFTRFLFAIYTVSMTLKITLDID